MRHTIQRLYDAVLRPRLPRVIGVYNDGIPARTDRLLDATTHHPEYEAPLINGIRERTHAGDDVCIVGGGFGISAVAAAKTVGERGSVTVFEASEYHATEIIPETLELNDVEDTVDVRHAVVGEAISTYGATADAMEIQPQHLPGCDVLVMDCEGAELAILKRMEFRPAVVVVESHGPLGASTHDVHQSLDTLGYAVVNADPEVVEEDYMVLTALRPGVESRLSAADAVKYGFGDATPGVERLRAHRNKLAEAE